jgi:hypothetical protein
MRALLDRPIAYHRALVPIAAGALPALMLSQAIYWQLRTTSEDGWWWKTREEWGEETGLTRSEQETARKILKQRPWWAEELRGVPARKHYRVDLDLLFAQLAGIQPTSRQGSSQQDGENPTGKPATSQPANTETTIDHSETTTGGSEIWPELLTQAQRKACERELTNCAAVHRAVVVRELSNRLGRKDQEPLRLPHLWVRSLVRAAQSGTLARNAPSPPPTREQIDAVERDYQRRLNESRVRSARQLGLVGEGKTCS